MKFIKLIVPAFIILMASTNIVFSQTKTDSLQSETVKVKGITCSMDLKMISAHVEKLNGVTSCKVGKQGTTSTFEIKYNPTLVKKADIFSTIENTGSCENPDDRPYKVKQ